ncbi:pilus assembly protein TadG-related protein [Inquilinus sp. NPDC058860]|uniref:pilus assembly protein TadG-related protein n=1 Tax=Inquilinus sp. NPDC058860 TaxID=3346652 RepID=UPI003686FFEC
MNLRRIIAGWSEERGAIAPFAAIVLAVMIGLVALSTDLGSWFAQRRDLQAATDAAALAAVADQGNLKDRNVGAIKTQAALMLKENGSRYTASNINALTLGTYCADKGLEPFNRFRSAIALCPGDTRDASYVVANAVKVDVKDDASGFLSKVLQPLPASFQIRTSATAARIDEAAFQAGTGVLAVDTNQSAILNAVLGGLLGTSLQLNAVDYRGLLNTNIQALSFLDALAVNLDLSAGTYDQLLATNVQVSELIQAAIDVLDAPASIASISLAAIKAKIVGNPSLQLGDLLDLGIWRPLPVGSSTAPTALQAGLNLYQLLTLTLQVANGDNAVAIPNFDFNLLGILAGVHLEATVIEPPQSPPFAFGPVGISVHTAQVRLKLKIELATGLLKALLGSIVELPLYVEAGAGDAILSNIDCGIEPATDAQVQIDAKSGVARAYIGTIATDTMKNFTKEITYDDIQYSKIAGVDVLGLGVITLASLTGKAKVEIGSGSYQTLTFDQTDIANRTAQSVVSRGMVDNLLSSLGQTLELKLCTAVLLGVCILPLDLRLVPDAVNALRVILAPVINGLLDPLVDGLLAALGIKLGYMDVTVTGVRCGVPVLVQ